MDAQTKATDSRFAPIFFPAVIYKGKAVIKEEAADLQDHALDRL